ncbi:LSM14 family protein trailer hitch isoform X2 [Arctopsyche grandis]|uniref:LSM14 family protein trailer hitch isoform X2 n=1 Tax=Arctopsyche grandis TaxID=121162 RepID=UPI00406D738C
MAAGMPELGSKISLISKADIRYEGRLFTVDPQECTIALASVRSFGTEDRETQYPVAPQNQVYDYILFRGSDIKDIRVLNNVSSLPNDPAIMQLSVPPTLGPIGGAPYQQPQFNHPVVGPTQYPQYHPMGIPPALRPGPLAKQPSNMLEMIGGGSRAETPMSSGIQRKSPTTEQGTQAGSHHLQGGRQQQQQKGGIGSGQHRQNKQEQNDRNQNQSDHSRQPNRPRSQNRNLNQNQSHGQQDQHQHQHQHNQGSRHGQNQVWGHRGGRGGRGGRGRGGFNGRPQGQQGIVSGRPKNILKFENDYDFEQANTEFDKIRVQLAKVKITDGETPKPEAETEKKDDSGNETGAGEPEHEDDANDAVNCYDKTKSFFDNISCEAVERSKGRSQRRDWRTERKLNSETFGVATARRGGYRGRGYWGGGGGGMQSGWRGQPWRGGNRGGRAPQQFRQNRQGQNQMQQQQTPISVPGK